jgi:hypothetical protein
VLMVVASDGLYQFDYTDPSHVAALSSIVINNLKS